MSRYESPGQVALLLAGATLASLLLIVFFTAEAKNRKASRELDIEGDGILSSFRHQMSRLTGGLRGTLGDSETHRSDGTTINNKKRRRRRSLGGGHRDYPDLEVSRDPEEEEDDDRKDQKNLPTTTPRPRHAFRHRHRQRQHYRHRDRNLSTTSVTTAPPSSPSLPHTITPPTSPPSQRVIESNTVDESGGRLWHSSEEEGQRSEAVTPTESDVSSTLRDGHAACYGPDQVVLIIALTCALNFACIFLVMALVHICNRNRKCASSGCDSPLLLVDSDYEVDPKACLMSSADEDDEYDEDVEVDALLLAKRPSASLFGPFLPPPFLPPPIRHPPPWRPSSRPSACKAGLDTKSTSTVSVGGLMGSGGVGERRRCGTLSSSSSSNAIGTSVASFSASRPLLPPAAFSMEDLHILE